MANTFTPREIINQDVQYPDRWELRDINTGEVIGVYDITKYFVPGDIKGTLPDDSWLSPIEAFLGEISNDLTALGLEIQAVNQSLSNQVSAANASISAAEGRINTNIGTVSTNIANVNTILGTIDTTISGLAPKVNAVLTNPTANTVAISTNNTSIAVTAAVKTYLDSLFTAFKG